MKRRLATSLGWGALLGLVAMFLMPATGWWILAGFIAFRVFDIWKPFPIRAVEKRLGLGGGIMTDDLVAGLYALGVLHGAKYLLEHFATG